MSRPQVDDEDQCSESLIQVLTHQNTVMNSLRPALGLAAKASRTRTPHHQYPGGSFGCCRGTRRSVHIEKRLEDLGIELPMAPTPKANYNIVCHANGNMLYISGHLPVKTDGSLITGRIGPKSGGESIAHGYEAARYAGLNIVSTLKEQLGDLDRVEQVVKVCMFVSSCLVE